MPLIFGTDNLERIRVEPGGNVGIGTTTPGSLLDVNGNTKVRADLLLANDANTQSVSVKAPDSLAAAYTLTLPDGDGTSGQVLQTDGSGVLSWATPAAGADDLGDHTVDQTLNLNGNWISGDTDAEGIFVDTDGLVGIGTNNPYEMLHLYGFSANNVGLYVENTGFGANSYAQTTYKNAVTNAVLYVGAGNTGSAFPNEAYISAAGQFDSLRIQTNGTNPIIFSTNTVEAMRLDSGGNLNMLTENELRFQDAADGNYVGFRAPASMTNASIAWELPDGDGTSGQVLSTDGSGVLSWVTNAPTMAIDDLTDADTSSGTNNFYLGSGAGNGGSGADNVAIAGALTSLTSGSANIAVGNGAAAAVTTGSGAIAIGHNAGAAATNMAGGVVIGDEAADATSNTSQSVIIGGSALAAATNAVSNNVAIGFSAMGAANGIANQGSVAIGSLALNNNGSGYNTAVGYQAGQGVTSGIENVFLGREAGTPVATGTATQNTMLGARSGDSITGADNNVLVGFRSGDEITSGDNNIVIGYDIDTSSATASNELNIGALIFGNGLNGADTGISSGNLGIGVRPSLGEKLEVAGDIRTTADVRLGDADNSNYVAFSAPATVAANVTWTLPAADGASGQVLSTDGSGVMSWVTPASGADDLGDHTVDQTLNLNGNWISGDTDAEGVFVATNGNVGINTANPQSFFHIHGGSDNYSQTSYTTNATGSTVSDGFEVGYYDPSGAFLNNFENSPITFGTSNVERMRIAGSGNVGIGTNNPTRLFHIEDSANLANNKAILLLNPNLTSGNSNEIAIGKAESTKDHGTLKYTYSSAGSDNNRISLGFHTVGDRLVVQAGGNVGIGTSTPQSTLTVNGAITNQGVAADDDGTINFATGNIQYTTNSCSAGINLHNMKSGGSYTFIVQGDSDATACSFNAYSDGGSTSLTVHMPADHGTPTANKDTVYTIIVAGTEAYFSWVPGL